MTEKAGKPQDHTHPPLITSPTHRNEKSTEARPKFPTTDSTPIYRANQVEQEHRKPLLPGVANAGPVIPDTPQMLPPLGGKGSRLRSFVTLRDQPPHSSSTVRRIYSQEGVGYRTEPKRQISQLSLLQNQDKKKRSRRSGNDS
jgi:hypothetical protein